MFPSSRLLQQLSEKELTKLLENWSKFLFSNFDHSRLEESDFLNRLDQNKQSTVSTVVSIRQDDMKRYLARLAASKEHKLLQNFDWKLNLVVSSDQMDSLNEPLLNLKLLAGQNKQIDLELNRTELDALIHSLQDAQHQLTQV